MFVFTYTGVNYLCPFEVTIGRRKELRYSSNTSGTSFISQYGQHCIGMISRRGIPKAFFSDNRTNLRALQKELKQSLKELDQSKLVTEMAIREIKWNFIPHTICFFPYGWFMRSSSVFCANCVTSGFTRKNSTGRSTSYTVC